MSLLVVGSVALDSIETPFGSVDDALAVSATASGDVLIDRPLGSAAISDSAAESRPFTTTICVRTAPSKRNGSSAARGSSGAGAVSNGASAMGATFVKRHSSSRVVG